MAAEATPLGMIDPTFSPIRNDDSNRHLYGGAIHNLYSYDLRPLKCCYLHYGRNKEDICTMQKRGTFGFGHICDSRIPYPR